MWCLPDNSTQDIDLVHCRIRSISSLRLERFQKLQVIPRPRILFGKTVLCWQFLCCLVQRLCLRQNQITRIAFPPNVAATLTDLDLYDNLISHIKGLEDFHDLTSLDLSFNKIKHIKNISHLMKLTDLYFVQNKISKIEGLEGLTALRNLELGGNRIRVRTRLFLFSSLLADIWLEL